MHHSAYSVVVNFFSFFQGETADTLLALRYCRDRGALIVGMTNTGLNKIQFT